MSENKSNLTIIIAGIAALVLGLGLGFYTDFDKPEKNQSPTISGVILPTAKSLSEFRLQDHNGAAFNRQSLHGQWSLIFLGYTSCPDICPATLGMVKQTVSLLSSKEESKGEIPRIVFVSVDPDRDTAEKLAEYVSYFNPDFLGVTGEQAELKKLALGLSVYYKKVPGSSGDENADDYLMDHSAGLMLVNPDGNLQAFLTGPHEPAKIADSIIKTIEYYNNR